MAKQISSRQSSAQKPSVVPLLTRNKGRGSHDGLRLYLLSLLALPQPPWPWWSSTVPGTFYTSGPLHLLFSLLENLFLSLLLNLFYAFAHCYLHGRLSLTFLLKVKHCSHRPPSTLASFHILFLSYCVWAWNIFYILSAFLLH